MIVCPIDPPEWNLPCPRRFACEAGGFADFYN